MELIDEYSIILYAEVVEVEAFGEICQRRSWEEDWVFEFYHIKVKRIIISMFPIRRKNGFLTFLWNFQTPTKEMNLRDC